MKCLNCLYPRILISSVSCVLACTLTPSHPYILVFMCTCLYPTSLHTHILRFMCRRLHPCILLSSGSRVLACNLASSHPHVLRFMFSRCFLVSSYPHILRFQCSQIFRKLESDKNNGSNENRRPLWKQIMALTNF